MRTQHPSYTVPVARLTLTINDEALQRACQRAVVAATSVDAVVREHRPQLDARRATRGSRAVT